MRMNFRNASNNEAEYETLLHGMCMAKACGATRLMIYGDSNLVVQQGMKLCDAVNDNMVAYRDLYNALEGEFDGCELNHIGRASNEEADALANIGPTRAQVPTGVFLEQINERSIKVKPPKIQAKPAAEGEDAAKEAVEAPKVAVETEDAIEMFALEAAWTQPYLDYIL